VASTSHDPGTAFIEMLRERMPEKLVHSNVGSRFRSVA